MKAVIYVRVSRDEHKDQRSVESQEEHCRAFCERQGWDVVRVFSDNDLGASRHSLKDRPSYNAMVKWLPTSGVNVLVAWTNTRTTRDDREYLDLVDLCVETGLLYSYAGKVFDLTRYDDRFAAGLDQLIAAREADVIAENVRRGRETGAKAGRPGGRLLYGYTREYDSHRAFVRQIAHPVQGPIVRQIFASSYAGDPAYKIAADLNARGVLSPGGTAWCDTIVRRLLTNPAYAGWRVHQRRIVGRADWPALVTPEVQNAIQARYAAARSDTVRDRDVKYLLTGGMYCAVDGGGMRSQRTRGVSHYACNLGFCTGITMHRADSLIVNLLMERFGAPDAVDLFEEERGRTRHTDYAAVLEEKVQLLADVRKRALAGKLGLDFLEEAEAQLIPEIEDLRLLAAPPAPLPDWVGQLCVPNPLPVWKRMSILTRRRIVRSMLDIRLKRAIPSGPAGQPAHERIDVTGKPLP